MHNRVELRVQKINSNAFDSLLEEEIDEYINHAIVKFVKDRFEPRSNQLGLGFEQSTKRIEDLKELISSSELDTEEVTQLYIEGMYADKAAIPADFFLAISVALKVFYNDEGLTFTVPSTKRVPDGVLDTDYGELRVSAKPVQHDDVLALLTDPFNKPKITEGIFTVDNGEIYAYTDDRFIVDKVVLTYIRQPATVSLSGGTDCDLSPNVHDEIVDMTAKLILGDIEALGKQAQYESLNDLE